MEQGLADIGDGEELIETEVVVCMRRTADYSPPIYGSSEKYGS